jgi:hypothetical protein
MARCTSLSMFAVAVTLLATAAKCGDADDPQDGSTGEGEGGSQSADSGSGGSGNDSDAGRGTSGTSGAGRAGTGSGDSGSGAAGDASQPSVDGGSTACDPPCSNGQECVLEQVTCVRAPCPPQPTCVAAGGSGRACGSRALGPCPDGEFCDYPPSAICGAADAPGECRTPPAFCQSDFAPVCGCDGETYSNACEAASAGTSVSSEGECGGSSAELHDCDLDKVACEAAEPTCPEGEVPSVNGICYGPCVAIDACACKGPDDCPLPEQYTCHLSAGHCGPYV